MEGGLHPPNFQFSSGDNVIILIVIINGGGLRPPQPPRRGGCAPPRPPAEKFKPNTHAVEFKTLPSTIFYECYTNDCLVSSSSITFIVFSQFS